MLTLRKLYNWYGKKTVLTVLSIIGVLIIAALISTLATSNDRDEAENINNVQTVQVGTVRSLAVSDGASFIGTVRAVSEAAIQSEVGGRVTSVRVQAGDTVSVGTVIATLENALEQASVLQAQGVYEAAQAAAASSNVSVEQAQNSLLTARNAAVSTNRSAYTSANNILLNTIDQFYANPQSGIIGFKLDGSGAIFNTKRTALRTSYLAWQGAVNDLTVNSNLASITAESDARVREVLVLIDDLISNVADPNRNKNLSEVERSGYATTLASAKGTLNGLLTSLDAAGTSIVSAEEGVRQAQIGGTNSDVSAANAQIKQALGSLRSAQANLSKTILRTPIAGTVNSLQVHVGDFITSFSPVAEVANNGSLEISIFLGESDLSKLAVGNEVLIEGEYRGVVANIAPALDPNTLKTEVKIATDVQELTNGDTVTVSIDVDRLTPSANTPLVIPITAVKFTATAGSVFTVDEGVLQSRPVVLGPITGAYITIIEGIDHDTQFVLDARGLSVGGSVEAVSSDR